MWFLGAEVEAESKKQPPNKGNGFFRNLSKPVQLVIVIALILSWSAVGLYLFDFVDDNQIAGEFPISHQHTLKNTAVHWLY